MAASSASRSVHRGARRPRARAGLSGAKAPCRSATRVDSAPAGRNAALSFSWTPVSLPASGARTASSPSHAAMIPTTAANNQGRRLRSSGVPGTMLHGTARSHPGWGFDPNARPVPGAYAARRDRPHVRPCRLRPGRRALPGGLGRAAPPACGADRRSRFRTPACCLSTRPSTPPGAGRIPGTAPPTARRSWRWTGEARSPGMGRVSSSAIPSSSWPSRWTSSRTCAGSRRR